MPDEKWFPGKATIGSYIRTQRELSRLSLRELARMSQVSNAYLSQIERGMHEPSLRVLAAVAEALSLPLEGLTARARPDAEPAKLALRSTQSPLRSWPRRGSPRRRSRHFSRCTPAILLRASDTQRNSVD